MSKKKIKKAVKNFLSPFNSRLCIPLNFDQIIGQYKNIKLNPYSKFQKKSGKSIDEVLEFFGSKDAVCDCDYIKGRYIIWYNDFHVDLLIYNRHRFSIAHEIGHIFLGHFNKNSTRLHRNELIEEEYVQMENEADLFAAYILSPYASFIGEPIPSHTTLKSLCMISRQAAKYRYNDLKKWMDSRKIAKMELATKNHIQTDWFDKLLYEKFTTLRYCLRCRSVTGKYRHCSICGSSDLILYTGQFTFCLIEGGPMKYSQVEINENGKALTCPICQNENVVEGDYCQICGSNIVNKCMNDNPHECGIILNSDSRFCHFCGSISTFACFGILKSWTDETNFVFKVEDNISDFPGFMDVSDLEVPF